MGKTYRHMHLTPPTPRPVAATAPPVVRLLALCRNCGLPFTPTGPHVDHCHGCQLPAERRAYRRIERKRVTA